METAIITSLIGGVFALATALGSVWLKHYLEQPRPDPANARPGAEAPHPAPTQPRPHLALAARPLGVLLVSFAVGAVFRHYKSTGAQESMALAGLYAFIVVAFLALVLIHRRWPNGIWPYQLDCLALWAAWASGYLFANGSFWGDVIVDTAMFWFAFAVVGGAIVWFTRPRHPAAS